MAVTYAGSCSSRIGYPFSQPKSASGQADAVAGGQ